MSEYNQRETLHRNYTKNDVSRRDFLKVLGFGAVGAALAASPMGQSAMDKAISRLNTPTGYQLYDGAGPPGSDEIHLGDQGLRDGDTIDPYLSNHMGSGNIVIIPSGNYQWNGSGLQGTYNDASVIGEGDVVFNLTRDSVGGSVEAVDGGDAHVENIYFDLDLSSGSSGSRIRTDALHPDSTVTWLDVVMDSGFDDGGGGQGQYTGRTHQGVANFICNHIEGHADNGMYLGNYHQSRSGGGGGRVHVEGCFLQNNNIDNIRLGGDGDVARNCIIIGEEVPVHHTGGTTGRGIRVRYPGEGIEVENVHMVMHTSTPFGTSSRMEQPGSGTIDGLYIENHTSSAAVDIESGTVSWEGRNIHTTGSRTTVRGLSSQQNVNEGSGAESPSTSFEELGIEECDVDIAGATGGHTIC